MTPGFRRDDTCGKKKRGDMMTADEKRKERLDRELHTHLEPGETLLWSGQPQAGLVLRVHELFMVPITLLWCSVLLPVGVLSADALLRHPERIAFGALPLMLVVMPVAFGFGFYALIGRFLLDDRLQKKTIYAVTDRRLLIMSGLWWRWVRERPFDRISWIRAWRHWSGRTTIIFGPYPFIHSPRVAGFRSPRFGWFVFERIEEGAAVLSLLAEKRGDIDVEGEGRKTADHLLKIMGALSLVLAAAMGLGLAMEVPVLFAAYGGTVESRGALTGITLLTAYAATGAAAALCNGILCWQKRKEGVPLPVVFHVTNGLFLAVHLAGLIAAWEVWRCCTVGLSVDPAFFTVVIFIPIAVIFSGYFMLLARHRWRWKGGILEW